MKKMVLSLLLLVIITFSSCTISPETFSSDTSSEESSSEFEFPENDHGSSLNIPDTSSDVSQDDFSSVDSSDPVSSSGSSSSGGSSSTGSSSSGYSSPVSSSSGSSSSSSSSTSSSNTSSSTPPKEDTYLPKEEISNFYGYSILSSNEQDAYAALYNAIENQVTEVNVKDYGVTKDSLKKIMSYLVSDHAELIGLSKSYNYTTDSGSGNVVAVSFSYTSAKSERDKKLKKAASAAAPVINSLKTKSTYDKIKGVHDWIINNTQYDTSAASMGSSQSDAFNIYGVFVNKKAVCEGYSKAFQYMMYKLGIPCLIVYGESGGVYHSWNLVSVDGVYYHIDVTQDDPISASEPILLYSYFLLTDSDIKVTHSVSNDGSNYPLPSATSSKMNYFVNENRYLTVYNRDKVTEVISKDVKNRSKFTYIRFSSQAELDKATEKLGNIISQVKNDTHVSFSYAKIVSDRSPVYALTLRIRYS